VSSPLLEDINLAGAQGILVNVTAGLDLSIGEFEEVGTIVKEYASEDATVVVGTVIDPEMSNQIRVTVVATGLNGTTGSQRGRAEIARESLHERAVATGRDALSRRGGNGIARIGELARGTDGAAGRQSPRTHERQRLFRARQANHRAPTRRRR